MKTRIGVLTSGGDCPGLNAVLRGVGHKLIDHVLERGVFEHAVARGRHVMVGDAEGQVRPRNLGVARVDLVEALKGPLVDVMPVDPHQ